MQPDLLRHSFGSVVRLGKTWGAVGVFLCVCGVTHTAWAQASITGWTLTTSDAADKTQGAYTYENTNYAVSQFTSGSNTYYFSGQQATNVFIRRNTDTSGNAVANESGVDNNNYSSVWNVQGGSTTTVKGEYFAGLDNHLLNNNILQGADNLFSNSSTAATLTAGNIERVDFRWSTSQVVYGSEGIVVFDRSGAGAGDTFKVAVFTGWSNNEPTVYAGNVVTVTSGNYGSQLDVDPNTAGTQTDLGTYRILRNNLGDDLSSVYQNDAGTSQGIVGTFISFASLGIADGTSIKGYSIMAADVTTNVANLANWNNATYYPTSTSDANGGLDLVSVGGFIAGVPEPSTYGMIFAGFALVAYLANRRRLLPVRARA